MTAGGHTPHANRKASHDLPENLVREEMGKDTSSLKANGGINRLWGKSRGDFYMGRHRY